MKSLIKRWVAFCVGLMIALHSCFLPAFAEDSASDVPEDIVVDPTDYVDEYGVAPASLGISLSIAQIAAIIAAGGGAIYASQYLDDLGQHLSNALNTAASEIDGRTAALTQWLADAATGNIALKSAPAWITQTIMNTLHGIITAVSPVVGVYDFGGYPAPISGQIVSAGTPVYIGGVDVGSDGTPYISSSYRYVFDFDTVMFRFCHYEDESGSYTCTEQTVFLFNLNPGVSSGSYVKGSDTYSWSPTRSYVSKTTGATYYYWKFNAGLSTYDNVKLLEGYQQLILPGAWELDDPWNYGGVYAFDLFDKFLAGDVIDGYGAIPEGDAVAPDVLIGGLPDVWVGQGLGSDVVTMPDINVGGSDVLAPDTSLDGSAAYDAAIEAALEKLKTGELTWDDFWLDIAGSGPLVNVEEGEDTGPELQLPDWFVDFCNDILGNDADRNPSIDADLPGANDDLGIIDQIEGDIGDQMDEALIDLDITGFTLSAAILAALAWITRWVVEFFNASGEAQVVILLPLYIGLALLFIGRGSLAMTRVDWDKYSTKKEK